MCGTCGCADGARLTILGPAQTGVTGGGAADHAGGHDHGGAAGHDGGHDHGGHGRSRTIVLQHNVRAKNDRIAERNRAWLHGRGVLAVNLMSSPGAGKTTLLERTAADLGRDPGIFVIEGDQETTLDADRIVAAGAAVAQINTGAGCHLDAAMVARALHTLDPPAGSVVVIENVGNLVCPALFDLGEHSRVVMTSVTEGADKPAKYPGMFRSADLVLLNKIDLLPYVAFDTARHRADLRVISPAAQILPLSATTGDGVPAWYAWLREHLDR